MCRLDEPCATCAAAAASSSQSTASAGRFLSLSELRVHSVHLDSSTASGLSPVRSEAQAAVINTSWLAALSGNGACSATDTHVVELLDNALCIRECTETGSTMKVKVQLLFTEVSLTFDKMKKCPVLVVTDPLATSSLMSRMMDKATKNTWMFEVWGSQADGLAILDLLSERGAIRPKFPAGYSVDPTPISGTSSQVFGVIHAAEGDCSSQPGTGSLSSQADAGTSSSRRYAAKLVARSQRIEQAALRREVSLLLASQGHPNIVRFRGLFRSSLSGAGGTDNEAYLCMMMDYGYGCDLYSKVAAEKRLCGPQVKETAFGLLQALNFLNATIGIVHRAVQPENVLIYDCGRPVLMDFDRAVRLGEQVESSRRAGSPGFVAPELLLGNGNKIRDPAKIDMFSFGVLLYFTVTGRMPFEGSTLPSVTKKTLRCRVDYSDPAFTSDNDNCTGLLQRLLRSDPSQRASAAQALTDPWIAGTLGEEAPGDSRSLMRASTSFEVAPPPEPVRGFFRRRRISAHTQTEARNDEMTRRLMEQTRNTFSNSSPAPRELEPVTSNSLTASEIGSKNAGAAGRTTEDASRSPSPTTPTTPRKGGGCWTPRRRGTSLASVEPSHNRPRSAKLQIPGDETVVAVVDRSSFGRCYGQIQQYSDGEGDASMTSAGSFCQESDAGTATSVNSIASARSVTSPRTSSVISQRSNLGGSSLDGRIAQPPHEEGVHHEGAGSSSLFRPAGSKKDRSHRSSKKSASVSRDFSSLSKEASLAAPASTPGRRNSRTRQFSEEVVSGSYLLDRVETMATIPASFLENEDLVSDDGGSFSPLRSKVPAIGELADGEAEKGRPQLPPTARKQESQPIWRVRRAMQAKTETKVEEDGPNRGSVLPRPLRAAILRPAEKAAV